MIAIVIVIFFIELPTAVNILEKCICYMDDIVMPVSWTMIDSRNNQLDVGYRIGEVIKEETVEIPSGNYNGNTFSKALETSMNSILIPFLTPVVITYDNMNNKLSILLTDNRASKDGELEVAILEDKFIASAFSISAGDVRSVNSVLMLTRPTMLFPTIVKTFVFRYAYN